MFVLLLCDVCFQQMSDADADADLGNTTVSSLAVSSLLMAHLFCVHLLTINICSKCDCSCFVICIASKSMPMTLCAFLFTFNMLYYIMQVLNSRIQSFNFGYYEMKDKPPLLTKSVFENEQLSMDI